MLCYGGACKRIGGNWDVMKIGWVRGAALGMMAAMLVPAAAPAQQFSDSYTFLKAVRDRDGTKATDMINEPGTTVIDTRDRVTGDTALHIVTRGRDTTWLAFLLAKGAKPDTRDNNGNTPLMIAAQIGFAEGAQQLIARKARVDLANSGGETPLIRAVQNRDMGLVRMLLAAGANPRLSDTIAGMSARDYAQRDSRASAILKMLDEQQVKKPANVAGPTL